MPTAEKKNKYTVDDYLLLEEGAPFQLINYDLIRSPSPLLAHQLISAKIFYYLYVFLEANNDNGILVSAPIDVKLDDGNVLQPDILYISPQRKEKIVKDRIEGAPDLVVEILSSSSAYHNLRSKYDVYEKYGVKEYIIIDPIAQNADLYVLREGAYYLHQRAGINETLNSVLLAGFGLELNKMFK